MTPFAVIPVLNESAAIAPLVRGLLAGPFEGVVVVDGGSSDNTAHIARAAGAHVIDQHRHGYGRAVMSGAAAASSRGADVITFLDGNGTVGPEQAAAVLAPALHERADVVIGCREGHALRLMQRTGNRLAVEVIARLWGTRYDDIGSVRTTRVDALEALSLDEPTYGWPLQLQIRAAALRLRIAQVPIELQPRRSRSKVSGTVRGRLGATAAFLRVLATHRVTHR